MLEVTDGGGGLATKTQIAFQFMSIKNNCPPRSHSLNNCCECCFSVLPGKCDQGSDYCGVQTCKLGHTRYLHFPIGSSLNTCRLSNRSLATVTRHGGPVKFSPLAEAMFIRLIIRAIFSIHQSLQTGVFFTTFPKPKAQILGMETVVNFVFTCSHVSCSLTN